MLAGLSSQAVNALNTKRVSLIAVLSAATVVVSYARGLSVVLPGIVEFMTVMIFVSGFCFGWAVGVPVGFIAVILYMIIPYPFAHPAAWIYSISPLLLIIMGALGVMYGVVGALLGKMQSPVKVSPRFIIEMAVVGFILTFLYDVLSSIGFFLAYPVYPSVWEAIYLTFVPLYYVYPPIIHTVTNTIVFATVAPALILGLQHFRLQEDT